MAVFRLVRRVPMRALAEDRPTDPDERRALLDGDLEVIGHPHRELGTERRASRAQFLRDPAEVGERGTRCLICKNSSAATTSRATTC